MASLRATAAKPGLDAVLDILAIEPGASLDPAIWPYAGFKGGQELGVLCGTWLLRRADDRWFAVAIWLNDPAQPIDEGRGMAMASAALSLLAQVA